MKNRNNNPSPQRKSRRKRTILTWGAVGAETLRSFIATLSDNGCAVLFGRTLDGGALMVNCLCGDERRKEYISTYADIPLTFVDLLEDLCSQEDFTDILGNVVKFPDGTQNTPEDPKAG